MTHDVPQEDDTSGRKPLAKRSGAPTPPKHPNLLRKPYFYDNQMKRMLVQLMACFSGYQVKTGLQRDGEPRWMDVPLIYGSMQKTVGYILQGGSENNMSYLPVMSLYVERIQQKAEWRQNAQHHEKFRYIERARDQDGKLLVNEPGKMKTVERYQPVPYDIGFTVAIWASNEDQALQILEPILTVFNPDMEIQLSNSPADWTIHTTILFGGDVAIERVVPEGGEVDNIYVYTLPFTTVLWLSAPVKVYDTTPIYEVNVPIKQIEEGLDFDSFDTLDGLVIRADDEDIIAFESFN